MSKLLPSLTGNTNIAQKVFKNTILSKDTRFLGSHGGARDDGAKFIWYDQIDEILTLTAKVVGVLGGINQGVSILETGTSNAPINANHEDDGDVELSSTQSPTHSGRASSIGTRLVNIGSSVQQI